MAALDELKAASERKVFLDAQSADLIDAITTLEDAIHKIDQETRTLLQGTFDEVNRHFSDLFPRLFGGGQAKIMTGDEILDAGAGDGAAAGQEERDDPPAVGRREG